MRAHRLLLPTLGASVLWVTPMAAAQDDPIEKRAGEAIAAFDAQREQAVHDALDALTTGDPVEAALALTQAIEEVGEHPALMSSLERVRKPAAQAAAARIARLLDEDDAAGALNLLARLRAVVRSDRLDGLIDRAVLAQRLEDSARFEAVGETAEAMRTAVLASNIAPDDPRVRSVMTRLGLRTAAPAPATTARPSTTNNGQDDDRIDTLEREVRAIKDARRLESSGGGGSDIALETSLRLDGLEQQLRSVSQVVDRFTRSLADIESRQRLDGRAEYATDELDRRVRDLERVIGEVRRSVSRVESDVRELNRRIDRIR